MKPDPYKQERSRRYLAKQRVKYGEKKNVQVDGEGKRTDFGLPRWLKNLPSNSDRYENESGTIRDESSGEEDEFDINSTEQLEGLLESVKLQSPVNTGPIISQEKPCSTYEKWTSINVDDLLLSTIPKVDNVTEAETSDLPLWFVAHWRQTLQSKLSVSRPTKVQLSSGLDFSKLQKSNRALNKVDKTLTKFQAKQDNSYSPGKASERTELESWLDDAL